MKIGIVGLGLIGGSLAKAIKKNTEHSCFALDIDRAAIAGAIAQEAIDGEITSDELRTCDVTIVCLHPEQTISFILENKTKFKKNSIVIDSCGVKAAIVEAVEKPLAEEGVSFLGCHPMAGREFSGFAYSVDNLFEKASFIMTPTDDLPAKAVREISQLAYEIGFARVVTSTTEEHDRIIAFTSQLAHVVSSAYVKSPEAQKRRGFSAGSFRDMTRVARLDEHMWTELFLENADYLGEELDILIANLQEYSKALKAQDADTLCALLKDGREKKATAGGN